MATASVLLSAVALVIGVKSRHVRRVLYQTDDHAVVGTKGLPDVEIHYQGEAVAPVSSAAVVLWNGGTEIIRGDDVAAGDPLRIDIPEGGRVLEAHISARTREVTQSKIIAESPTSVRLTFDFLDPGNGIRARMLYMGQPGVAVRGTIKGVQQGLQAVADGELVGLVKPLHLLYVGLATILVGLISAALIGDLFQGEPWMMLMLAIATATAVGAIATAPRGAWQRRFRVPDDLAPWREGG